MKKSVFFSLLISCLMSAQKQFDTITRWKENFATLGGFPKISPQGNWIGINKHYKLGGDTAYAVNTNGKAVYKIVSTGMLEFLKDEGVFGRKANHLQFVNLKTGKTYQYDHVKSYYRLDQLNRYAVHTSDNRLCFFDLTGNQLSEISCNTEHLVANNRNKLYMINLRGGLSEVVQNFRFNNRKVIFNKKPGRKD